MSWVNGWGLRVSCGDTEGPWVWDDSRGWLCEECYEKIDIKAKRKVNSGNGEKTVRRNISGNA